MGHGAVCSESNLKVISTNKLEKERKDINQNV